MGRVKQQIMPSVYDPFDFPYRNGPLEQWAPPLLNVLFGVKSEDLVVQFDIVHDFNMIVEEPVLVMGGGPSTLQHLDYDKCKYRWSMNYAYRNLKNVALLAVGANVDITSDEFLDWQYYEGGVLAFEIHPKWGGMRRHINKLSGSTQYFHTQIYGKIGVGARLINLAAALGAPEVHFIGLDGPEAILKGQHAFEPGKRELPSSCNESNAQDIHQYQYDFFWEYIRRLYPNTKFVSIDKNNVLHRGLNDT